MINKRPFGDENSCEVASKRPRHCTNELFTVADVIPPQNASQKSLQDGEGDGSCTKCSFEGRSSSDSTTDVAKKTQESENVNSGGMAHYIWVNSSLIDADIPTSHLSLFPEFFEHTDHLRVLLKSDEVCTSPVDHPPQKLVAVGAEYQAYVPDWYQLGSSSSDHQTELVQGSDQGFADDDNKKMGACVISMPKLEVSLDCGSEERVSRDECTCPDSGSIRCVRQHVMEAREKLRENIGPKLFEDLGFCEMGEDIAKKWTGEEEHIFEEVVLANPVSLGKNFWDHLSVAFPSRSRKELVSYYFNVFMLRKRAGQNRFDPMNVDSDNDEWQQSDLGVREDDDDSVVESPNDQEASSNHQEDHSEDCNEDLGDTTDVDCRVGITEDDGGDVDDASGAFIHDSPGNNYSTKIDLRSKTANNKREDYDVLDDSCTSYEYQQDRAELCCPLDRGNLGSDARDCSVG